MNNIKVATIVIKIDEKELASEQQSHGYMIFFALLGCRIHRRTKESNWPCCYYRSSSEDGRYKTSCSRVKRGGRSSSGSCASPNGYVFVMLISTIRGLHRHQMVTSPSCNNDTSILKSGKRCAATVTSQTRWLSASKLGRGAILPRCFM